MAIPDNIKKEHIIQAIKKFKEEIKCDNKKEDKRYHYALVFNGEYYCPKDVIRKASLIARNKTNFEFYGGYGNVKTHANSFLEKLGFKIVEIESGISKPSKGDEVCIDKNCFTSSNLKLENYIVSSFYNSLKTKCFVILAGLSGTGKTKIFEEFVKCFPPLEESQKEKWIVIKETGEKLIPVKKEEIEFKKGKIKIKTFLKSLNKTLNSNTGGEIVLKVRNYYAELVPTVKRLKKKTKLIKAGEAEYITSIFGFEVVEREDIKRLNLKKLNKELEIREFERIKENNLFFPIRPDFKDPKSLLGYYNPLKGEYHSTPLLKFILEASKNYLQKGKNADPFFVLFDEMNLARVEYYFADFLSVLEAKRFENKDKAVKTNSFSEFLESLGKDLSVLNEDNYKFTSQSIKLHNEDINDIPKELFLPPNLYFVGTVNIDETTHMFSPKVLDRAFTIEFDVGSFENYLKFLKENSGNGNPNIDENLKEDFVNNGKFTVIDKQKIKEFFENEENKKYLETLEEINNTLRKFNLHFGYRVFDEIIMFLYNSKNSYFKFDTLDEAFDLAIKMKVLPKFHGTRQKLWNPIMELIKTLEIKEQNKQATNQEESEDNNENPNTQKEDIYSKIEKINSIPIFDDGYALKISLEGKGELKIITNYKHTAHKLLEMLYKLKSSGFASFM